MRLNRKSEVPENGEPLSAANVRQLLDLLKGVRYGSVTLVVQDGRVIQIDRNEKMRLI